MASALKDQGPSLFSRSNEKVKVLPVAVIYGANASGKTNVLKAILEMAQIVVNSHKGNTPDGPIHRNPFALDKESSSKTTRFDCDFIVSDKRFHYGFEFSEIIVEEWLYTFEGPYRRSLFYREGQGFTFGKHLRGRNRVTADITRPNSLFVSAAAQNNHEQLSEIYDYFRGIRSNMRHSLSDLPESFEKRVQSKDKLIKFLRSADTGISDAKIEYEEFDQETKKFTAELTEFLIKHIPQMSDALRSRPQSQAELALGHSAGGDRTVYFPLREESRGTLRAMELALDAFDALDSGTLLVIDELEASLHTLLSRSLVGLFSSESSNPKHAQLVCTTHDTNLLCFELLRRDQIWFTEKDLEGQTHLYPLTAIRTRNTDNLEKGYLQGRFGAVPFYGTISNLFEPADA